MKKGIHPETYRLVAFKDMSNETIFVTRSCAPSKETITVEGVEYPLVKLEISNTSHPFYTGKVKLVDTAGRVDMFYQRYKSAKRFSNRFPQEGAGCFFGETSYSILSLFSKFWQGLPKYGFPPRSA